MGCSCLLAVRQWSRRPRAGAEATVPRWLLVADRSTPRRAYAMGAVLVVEPEEPALTVAAAEPCRAGTGGQLAALLLFAVVGTAGLAVPLTLRIVTGSGPPAADALAAVAGAARDADRLRRARGDRPVLVVRGLTG